MFLWLDREGAIPLYRDKRKNALKKGGMVVDVVLYTTGCPQCRVLEKKLDESGIKYNVVTDVDEMIKMGFNTAPILKVDSEVMNSQQAFNWLLNR